jgi:hypothetical protein
MKKNNILFITLIVFMAISCTTKITELPVVTRQIQYLVLVKNPDTIPDNLHEYLDDTTRTQFLGNIIEQVLSGEVTAYVWNNNNLIPASTLELKKRFAWDKSIPLPDSIDTINFIVDLNKVTKIRYFEEWTMDKKNLVINKRVLGIALLLDNYDKTGMCRGWEPLFYVFYDQDFRGKLEEQYQP